MAVGKTTIGRNVAKKNKLKYLETDANIVKRNSKTIAEIFEKKGEDFFRKEEEKEVLKSLKKNNCIIALGGGAFINKTIRSVISQTYKKFEILIIYDDTENQDFTFIKKLLSIDKRIKIIKNKSNLGAGLSRNKGIKKAKGQYIAFLDADDIRQSNKIKYQVNFMEKNNIDVSHTSYHIINFDGKIIGERFAKNLNL